MPTDPTGQATILVVDDDPDLLAGYAMALEMQGHRLLLARSGEEAMTLARGKRLDVLVTDIVMPVMDGFELIEQLRADLGEGAPPAIVCSGFDITEREALERGAQVFLPKPADLDTLLEAIDSLMKKTAVPARTLARQRARAQDQRARVRDTARLELNDLDERETVDRGRPWLDWLRTYLDCAGAGVMLLRDGGLQPTVAVGTFPTDGPAGRFLTGNVGAVVETRTSLVIGDARRHPSFSQTLSPGAGIAFFAGVPLLVPPDMAVGALCVCDPEARRFEAESLVLLEHLGRRGPSQLVARHARPSWPAPTHEAPLLVRATVMILLSSELKVARRTHRTVELALLRLSPGVSPHAAALRLWEVGAGPRTAIGALGPDQVVLYKMGDGRQVMPQVATCLERLRAEGMLRAAGVVSADGEAGLTEEAMVGLAENALLASGTNDPEGQARRIVVQTS